MPRITPRETSSGSVGVFILVPCSPDLIAALRDAIMAMTEEENWEQIETTISIDDTVIAAREMLQSFEDNFA